MYVRMYVRAPQKNERTMKEIANKVCVGKFDSLTFLVSFSFLS